MRPDPLGVLPAAAAAGEEVSARGIAGRVACLQPGVGTMYPWSGPGVFREPGEEGRKGIASDQKESPPLLFLPVVASTLRMGKPQIKAMGVSTKRPVLCWFVLKGTA